MTKKVSTIVALPLEADSTLLDKGPLGAKPATYIVPFNLKEEEYYGYDGSSTYWSCSGCGQSHMDVHPDYPESLDYLIHGWYCSFRGLALAWEGKRITESCYRLAKYAEEDGIIIVSLVNRLLLDGDKEALEYLREIIARAHILLFDTEGNEIEGQRVEGRSS